MQTEYHKWYSQHLRQDMEIKIYGWYGKPVLVFPAQEGRYYDFENFGMIHAIADFIESGKIKVFAVDSIDSQSWANWNVHPADRATRHEEYDRYIVEEVVPFIWEKCAKAPQGILTTGCSMGGYHAANFFFRHPDVFDAVICLSGLFQLGMFVGDYMDQTIYYNSPLVYLPNLTDEWYLARYRKSQIVICCGQGAWEEAMQADARAMKAILDAKGIPAWVDFWGYDVNHDWPWWQKQLPYFLSRMDL